MEHDAVLEEVGGEQGLLLWRCARGVVLWATAAPEQRTALLNAAAGRRREEEIASVRIDPELREPLRVLATAQSAPGQPFGEAAARACLEVAEWAERRGALGTALHFSQTAALAAPYDARTALALGRSARRRAEHARSETALARALQLAAAARDWECYAMARVAHGNLYAQRGNYPAARRSHRRGLRAARRHGLREIEARALHDLFVVAAAGGAETEAEGYAEAALRAYGPGHPRLPALAHDVATLWTNCGEFARALPVFEAVLPHLTRPHERVMVFGNLARAAGGAGQDGVHQEAAAAVWRQVQRGDDGAGLAPALLSVARGAASLGIRAEAERAARTALELAGSRGEAPVRLEAEAMLAYARRPDPLTTSPAPSTAPVDGRDSLADALIRSLVGAPRR